MFVFSNLATSIDGKIGWSSREHAMIGSREDHRKLHALRAKADVVIVGASTLRAFRQFSTARGKRQQPANLILSTSLKGVSPRWEFFSDPKLKRILVVTRPLAPARLRLFERTSEVLLVPGKNTAHAVLAALRERGYKRILIEGGGDVMWSFLSAGLLDELHVTLTPWIIGGRNAPTLVDGLGFTVGKAPRFRLASLRKNGDELFLVYRKKNKGK